MGKYLTYQQFVDADLGLPDAPRLPYVTTEKAIQQAETQIDQYVGFAPANNGGFEPHSIFTQTEFDSKRKRTYLPSWPVPVRQVTRYRIYGSPAITAEVNLQDIGYEASENYIEVVPLSLQMATLFPLVDVFGFSSPIVQVDYDVGFFILSQNEVLIDTGDHQTYIAKRGFWVATSSNYTLATQLQPGYALPVPPTLSINTIAAAASVYTIDALNGYVTFTTPNMDGDLIRASYVYQIPDGVMMATLAQTKYLLAERRLNKLGMANLDRIQNTDQQAQRPRTFRNEHSALTDEAASYIADYVAVAIA